MFSGTLDLHKLVDNIYDSLRNKFFEGTKLYAIKDGKERRCKILKILDSVDTKKCKVGWIQKDKTVDEESEEIEAADLRSKRPPITRMMLEVVIRYARSQTHPPWFICDALATEYLQKEGRKRQSNGTIENGREKFKRGDPTEPEPPVVNLRCLCFVHSDKLLTLCFVDEAEGYVSILKYPIDDDLLSDDSVLCKGRPPLNKDFGVPGCCVGDLLVVWNFCSSFGRALNLSTFLLTDLQNAICHKESSNLLVEAHASMFHLLIEDGGKYFTDLQKKEKEEKVLS